MDKAPDAFRTISEVAADLAVPQHVLRFWETRFTQIKPMKRGGGRRYYRPDDVDLLRGIRHLLYGEGYTIRGVQRILREHGAKFVQTVWQENAPQPERRPGDDVEEAETTAANEDTGERGRGLLLGILPSLFAQDAEGEGSAGDGERREPTFGAEAAERAAHDEEEGDEDSDWRPAMSAALPRAEPAAPPPPAKIPREDLQKLHTALQELGECRRLIDAAVTDL